MKTSNLSRVAGKEQQQMHCTENFYLEPKGRGVAVCVYLFFQYSKFNSICICTARPDTTRELCRNCNELKIHIIFIYVSLF